MADILAIMDFLDLTLPLPAENLALDEALLEAAENGTGGQALRFWESAVTFAVLGFSRKASEDLDLAACERDGVPVLRRPSGGGTVLQGPGCLNFALVLRLDRDPQLRTIQGTNSWVLGRIAEALQPAAPGIEKRGISDLALNGRKVSGTAQRRKRSHVLFHGTLLHGFALGTIEKYLTHPKPQDEPDYRGGRVHGDFVTRITAEPAILKSYVRGAWAADQPLSGVPNDAVSELVRTRYSLPDWNFKY
jgi:lipoate-protein ligase A